VASYFFFKAKNNLLMKRLQGFVFTLQLVFIMLCRLFDCWNRHETTAAKAQIVKVNVCMVFIALIHR